MKTKTLPIRRTVIHGDSPFSHENGRLVIARRHEHHPIIFGTIIDGPKFGPNDQIPDFAFDDISHVDY